jgi:hypothetical protein
MKQHPYFPHHILEGGKLWVKGRHIFLKTGKPLRNYADYAEAEQLIRDLPKIVAKGYRNLAINCYWHHFNPSGDGRIEVSLEPLKKLVTAIRAEGMYATLSIETYGVGGGQIPERFWTKHPEALAINHLGEPVSDTEYGYGSKVPSLFAKEYLEASRSFVKNMVTGLGAENFLYFETTVEPQYMGAQWLDYSDNAREAYTLWAESYPGGSALPFPHEFPAGDHFIQSEAWNLFRAQALAGWINGDARALRAGGGDAPLWIASDYLDAEEDTMLQRCGNALEFLRNLTEVDIIQINWSWCNIERKPNHRAYERVKQIMRETGRDWAVTEHMTINGADYSPSDMPGLLENTLQNGTRFGWEFVDIAPDKDSPLTKPNDILPGDFKPQHFSVYDENWNPKPAMAVVEANWDDWLQKAVEPDSRFSSQTDSHKSL